MAEGGYSKNYFTPKNIIIYIIVGIVVYGLLYYFVFAKNNTYNSNSAGNTQQNSPYSSGQ